MVELSEPAEQAGRIAEHVRGEGLHPGPRSRQGRAEHRADEVGRLLLDFFGEADRRLGLA
jgi:hypothetical protein